MVTYRKKIDVSKLFEKIRDKRGVVGYFRYIRRKAIMGKEVHAWSMWVFVEHKARTEEEISELRRTDDLIPEMIDGVPTDVHEIREFLDDVNFVPAGGVYFLRCPGNEVLVPPFFFVFFGLFLMIALSFHVVGVPMVLIGVWLLSDHNRAVRLLKELAKNQEIIFKYQNVDMYT